MGFAYPILRNRTFQIEADTIPFLWYSSTDHKRKVEPRKCNRDQKMHELFGWPIERKWMIFCRGRDYFVFWMGLLSIFSIDFHHIEFQLLRKATNTFPCYSRVLKTRNSPCTWEHSISYWLKFFTQY